MKRILLICFMLLSALVTQSWAQERSVSGKVTDESGETLPGVNIILKGTSTGATSDIDGNWKLSVPTNGGTLVFQFVGMATQEIAIGNRSVVDITMAADAKQLAEVVVTAMGIERDKKSLGYAVAGVSDDQIQQKSEPDVLRTMQGKIPGVQISGSSGAPGSASRITIRGASSFLGSNSPLFVVDGIPFDNTQYNTTNQLSGGGAYGTPLSNLDPNTIASVNVLKGAAASALYGSRAAGGVIVITTKGGKASVSKKGLEVSYSTSYAIEKIANLPDYQNKYGNGSEFNYQNSNGSWGPAFAARDSFPTWTNYTAVFPDMPTNSPYVARPNNVSSLFQTGHVFENSLTVNGGNEKSSLSASFSKMDQDGYIPYSGFDRNTISVGGNTTLDNGFHAGANVSYTRSNTKGPFFGENGASGPEVASSFARTLWLGRTWNTDLPFENPQGGNVFFNTNTIDNPLWSWKHNKVKETTDRIGASVNIGYDITDWLHVSYKYGVNQYTTARKLIYDRGSNGFSGAGAIITDDINYEEKSGTGLISAERNLNDDFNLKALVGHNINERTTDEQRTLGTTLVAPGIFDIDNANTLVPYGGSYSKQRLIGYFYDVSLGYRDFLFFNTTGRNDISSTLPTNNNSYFYPSASLAFVISELLNLDGNILNFAKLRASVAKVGSDASPYSLNNTFNVNLGNSTGSIGAINGTDLPFKGQPALTQSNIASDPNLTPEFTTEYELGVQIDMFSNRVGLDLTYYHRNSTDQIAPISVPSATGYEQLYTNFGDLQNRGWEIGLSLTPVKMSNGLTWDIFFNYTKNISEVISLADGVERINIRNLFGGGIRPILEVGQPYGVLYGTKAARDDEGNFLVNPASGLLFPAVGEDRFGVIGNPNPNYTLDVTNTIKFKGLALSFLISYKDGGDIYSTTVERLLGRGVVADTEDREKSRIVPGYLGNPITGEPILDDANNKIRNTIQATTNDLYFASGGTNESFGINGADEMSVYDGTVIRLREISLAYSIPKSVLGKTPFGSATLSVSGRNLWYFAPNIPHSTNFDPEVNGFGSTNTQGIEYAAAPQAKRVGVNLKVTF